MESVSTDGHGRAVVTIGDTKSASNILVMPTAAGGDLWDGFHKTAATVNAIREKAGPDLAVVAYLGYDTPTGPGTRNAHLQPDEANAFGTKIALTPW